MTIPVKYADLFVTLLKQYGPMTQAQLAELAHISVFGMELAVAFSVLLENNLVHLNGGCVWLSPAPESPPDAPKPSDPATPTTKPSECGTGENGERRDEPSTDPRGDPYPAVEAMQAVSNLADYCRSLTAEYAALSDRVAYIDQLQADSDAYHALKAKLRDLTND